MTEEEKPVFAFTSLDKTYDPNGIARFWVLNPVDCNDFWHIIGHKVIVDGYEYTVLAIEFYTHAAPWRAGEKIGLLLKAIPKRSDSVQLRRQR